MRRYVQVHTLETPLNTTLQTGRGAQLPFDGVAEAWWDSVESLLVHGSTPEGRAAAREMVEDERRFIDLAASAIWLGEEHEIFGHSESGESSS
jgi:hypothetical protein